MNRFTNMSSIKPLRWFLVSSLWVGALGLTVLVSCSPEESDSAECTSSSDCEAGLVCFRGECGTGQTNNSTGGGTSPFGTGGGGGSACADAPLPSPGALILNEILAAVPSESDGGDANGDGVRDTGDDEFFEFVNVTNGVLRIDGLNIVKNADDELITVDDVCLEPNQALVIFGGLADGAEPPSLGGAQVVIADKNFGLSNSGANILVGLEDGAVLYDFSYPGVSNASATLDPQLDSTGSFVAHTDFTTEDGETLRFSPGFCANGKSFDTGCEDAPPVDPCPGASVPVAGDLILNEVLFAVPQNEPGDANGDGVRDSGDDEFFELVNLSGSTLRTQGITITKDGEVEATLQTACLPPGEAIVVFGGLEDGATPPSYPETIVEIAPTPFRMADSGGYTLVVATSTDTVLDTFAVPNANSQSIVRSPELDPSGVWIGHTEVSELLYSPGACANGAMFSTGCVGTPPDDVGVPDGGDTGGGDDVGDDTGGGDDVAPDTPPSECDLAPAAGIDDLVLNEIFTDVPTGIEGDANGDGVRDAGDDEFVELVNRTGALLRVEGVTVRKDDTVKATLSGCLEPGEAIVIFGGLADGAALPVQPGVFFYTADSNFSFANGGGTVRIVAADDATLIQEFIFPAGADDSFNRSPELDATAPFLNHSNVSPNGAIFSPGTCADGSPLPDGCQ